MVTQATATDFSLRGLIRSTDTFKEERKWARPLGWRTACVSFATHCTSSVTQRALSPVRCVAHSLQMQAWKEENVCSRDIKKWCLTPIWSPICTRAAWHDAAFSRSEFTQFLLHNSYFPALVAKAAGLSIEEEGLILHDTLNKIF